MKEEKLILMEYNSITKEKKLFEVELNDKEEIIKKKEL